MTIWTAVEDKQSREDLGPFRGLDDVLRRLGLKVFTSGTRKEMRGHCVSLWEDLGKADPQNKDNGGNRRLESVVLRGV